MNTELTSSRFPYVPVRWQVGQQIHEAEALLDTGFDRGIAVPPYFLKDKLLTLISAGHLPMAARFKPRSIGVLFRSYLSAHTRSYRRPRR